MILCYSDNRANTHHFHGDACSSISGVRLMQNRDTRALPASVYKGTDLASEDNLLQLIVSNSRINPCEQNNTCIVRVLLRASFQAKAAVAK